MEAERRMKWLKANQAARKLELLDDDEFDALLEEKFDKARIKRAAIQGVKNVKKHAGGFKKAAKDVAGKVLKRR